MTLITDPSIRNMINRATYISTTTIGIGAQSTLGGGTTSLLENMYKKISKIPKFL